MSIKVMLAFSNKIFSEGIGMVLAVEKDLRVVEVMTPGVEYAPEMWQSINPDVVLTDFTSLYNSFPELKTAKKLPFILLDTGCGKENIVSAILKKKVSGVLLSDSDSALLVKAIRAVAKGDIWIDKQTVKNLVYGINAIGKDASASLTEREKGVVSLIGQGFRNKEIAQKLNIKNRSELITFAIKNNDMADKRF